LVGWLALEIVRTFGPQSGFLSGGDEGVLVIAQN